MALRRLRENCFAIEARDGFVVALDVTRFDDLRRRGYLRDVQLGKRVDVLEQIAKLCAETFHLVVGKREASEFCNVSNVNLLG